VRRLLSASAALCLFTIAYPLFAVLAEISEGQVIFEDVLMRWMLPLLIAMWVVADAASRGRELCYDYGTFVFFAWPMMLPIYLFQSRRGKAVFNVLTFGAMGLIAYVEYWFLVKLLRSWPILLNESLQLSASSSFRLPSRSRWQMRSPLHWLGMKNRHQIGLVLVTVAAGLVGLGGCFDMALPSVPSNLLAYVRMEKGDLSPELTALLLGVFRALGGCLLAIGVGALMIINGPLRRGERGARSVLLVLIGIAEGINATQMWRFGSPFYFPLGMIALLVTGLGMLGRCGGDIRERGRQTTG
jgi:hypothetical protein